MTLLQELRKSRQLARSRRQPSLNFLRFSLGELLASIQAEAFPDIRQAATARFVSRGPLACVAYNEAAAEIYIHQVLNHPDTPQHVLAMILTHELLHLRIPPRLVDGKRMSHPPEFWAAERELCPWRDEAWSWMHLSFGRCLKSRPRLERTDVTAGWSQCGSRPFADDAGVGRQWVVALDLQGQCR